MAEYIHHINLMPGTPTGYYTITGEKDMTETEKKLVDAERAVDEAKQAVQDIRKAIESEAAEAAEEMPQWKVGDCFRIKYDTLKDDYFMISSKDSIIKPSGIEFGFNVLNDYVVELQGIGAERITFQEWAASRIVKEVW